MSSKDTNLWVKFIKHRCQTALLQRNIYHDKFWWFEVIVMKKSNESTKLSAA